MAPRKFDSEASEAMSRTAAYRKITKPRLEKKRRDKQNGHIDELRDLLFAAEDREAREAAGKMQKVEVLGVAVRFIREARIREAEILRAALGLTLSEVRRSLAVHGVEVSKGDRVLASLAASLELATANQRSRDHYQPIRGPNLDLQGASITQPMRGRYPNHMTSQLEAAVTQSQLRLHNNLFLRRPPQSRVLVTSLSSSTDGGYDSGQDLSPSPSRPSSSSSSSSSSELVWRPF